MKPELIFLDIEMPDKNGFELIKLLKQYNINSTVIFITAYNQYAINAIKNAAFDYLLKPIIFDDLKETLFRYKAQRNKIQANQINDLLNVLNNKIPFNVRCEGNDTIFINTDEIIYAEADGNYTNLILLEHKTELVSCNLGAVERKLPVNTFFRISRKHLINLNYLKKIMKKKSERICLLKANNNSYEVPIPFENVKDLQRIFKE